MRGFERLTAIPDRTFLIVVFCASRALIALGMLVIAPALPAPAGGSVPTPGFGIVEHWDGGWYRGIALSGYEFAPDAKQHNIAFFPLYPLVVRALMLCGLPFAVAAALVSNAAFAGLLAVIFGWMRERYGVSAARWTAATLCFLPLSLFTAVAYSESLFMLLSALALRDFQQGRVRAGLWAGLAALTRAPGLALLLAFAVAAFRSGRGSKAFAAAGIGLLGPACFALYCRLVFGSFLVPFAAQASWRSGLGINGGAWRIIFGNGVIASQHWIYHLLVAALCVYAWRRVRAAAPLVAYLACALLVQAELLLWDENGMKVLVYVLGTLALLALRDRFDCALLVYGLAGIVLVLSAGRPISIERIAFGILPFDVALAFLWNRAPLFGFAVLTVCAFELVQWSIAFAQWLWVA